MSNLDPLTLPQSPIVDLDGLKLYTNLPSDWLNSFEHDIDINPQLTWPWNYPVLTAPDHMPSGKDWPKISIVTVSYNHAHFIEETLRSVICQGYPNLEYIVIDGGSSDHTHQVIERYKHNIHLYISEPDNGQSHALNKGFQKATGEILAWLNSDDRYFPRTLFNVALAFEQYQTDLIVGGCVLFHDHDPSPWKTHHSSLPYGQSIQLPLKQLLDLDGAWQMGDFFYQPEVFWSRSIWEKTGAYVDENLYYSMDYELWVRMAAQKATIAHIPDSLAGYRMHEQQKTFGSELPFLPELRRVNSEAKSKYLLG